MDDTTTSSRDRRPHFVAWSVAKATDIAVEYLRKMELKVSIGKSEVVASSAKLRLSIIAMSRAKVLKGEAATKMLGAGYTGGARRDASSMRSRIKMVAARRSRVKHLRHRGSALPSMEVSRLSQP